MIVRWKYIVTETPVVLLHSASAAQAGECVGRGGSSRCVNICLLLQKSLLLGETEFDQLSYDTSLNLLCYETSKRHQVNF